MSKIDGRKAEIVNKGRRFSTYPAFAKRHGYPDAAIKSDCEEYRKPLQDGDIVTLLVSGKHEWGSYGTLWIIEAANGERHIIEEKGLRILSEQITWIKDEKLTGWEWKYTVTQSAGALPTLERTDIVRKTGGSDGAEYRLVERAARKGERIVFEADWKYCGEGPTCITAGTIYEIYDIDDDGEPAFRDDKCRRRYQYFMDKPKSYVLEPIGSAPPVSPPQPSAPAATLQHQIDGLTDAVAKLTRKVAEMDTKLRVAREDLVLIEEGVSADIKRLEAEVAKQSVSLHSAAITKQVAATNGLPPALTRDSAVKRAIADVADLRKFAKTPVTPILGRGRTTFYPNDGDRVEYVVDRDKRTVVALIKDNSGVFARGIAKCAPGDVFNEALGKAIALRRALGLPVPSEYLNAPKPEGVRVGDVVTGSRAGEGSYYNVNKRFTLTGVHGVDSFKYAENPSDYIYLRQIGEVIDDSARYETEVSA